MNRIIFLLSLISLSLFSGDKPLKIFILAGQSNMQGHADVRTIEHVGMDPKTKPLFEAMTDGKGNTITCEKVWISSVGNDQSGEEHSGKLTAGYGAMGRGKKIGPEYTFGIYMQKLLNEPILIIKTAWGGKSLNTDFRSPGSGQYKYNQTQLEQFKNQGKDVAKLSSERAAASGKYYKMMVDHINHVLSDIKRVYPDYNAKVGHEIAGFVWFQGWNDMVDRGTYPNRHLPDGYAEYSKLLAQFIRDVRKDFKTPKMPFVIGVMGVNGPLDKYPKAQQRYKGIHSAFRSGMAAPASMPEFKGNVTAVQTGDYWDMELAELRSRNNKIREFSKKLDKEGKLKGKEKQAAITKFKASPYTDKELEIMQKGASNAEFHYMGCAKVLGGIGKAFAESMKTMLK